jgi:predicted metallopeptidase
MIQYHLAEDIDSRVKEILRKLKLTHIDGTRLICLRSKGSGSRRVIARCHGLSRIMQLALNQKPHYVIEVLSERFDRLNQEDQTKVLIHEILHIPHSFGGGFRAHKPFVTGGKVQRIYDQFIKAK